MLAARAWSSLASGCFLWTKHGARGNCAGACRRNRVSFPQTPHIGRLVDRRRKLPSEEPEPLLGLSRDRYVMVVHFLCDFLKPGDGYAIPLLDGKWVICSFEFNEWPHPNLTTVYRRLEVQRLGIAWNRITEPAEIRRFIDPIGMIPQRTGTLEIRLAQ